MLCLFATLFRKSLLVRRLLENSKVKIDIISMEVLICVHIYCVCVYGCVLDSVFFLLHETTTAVVKYAEVRKENEEGEDEDVQLRRCWDRI